MKIRLFPKRGIKAAILVVTLVICSVLAFSVLGYLKVVEQQDLLGRRSQSWNIAISVAEAGVEEALQHLNSNQLNLGVDGWTLVGGGYNRSNYLSNGHGYVARIEPGTGTQPIIYSRAYVPSGTSFDTITTPLAVVGLTAPAGSGMSRMVRVRCYKGSLWSKALAAKHTIDLNGNGILTDSYDSESLTGSIGGLYDVSIAGDKGDVVSNDSILNAINVGAANIYGKVATGPGGSVSIGANGGVGSHTWQAANDGFQSGWVTDDANFTFPDTTLPYNSGLTPQPGDVAEWVDVTDKGVTTKVWQTNHYDNILVSGDYYLSELTGKTIVQGAARLVVGDNVSLSGNDVFKVQTGAEVKMWVGGTSASFTGNGVVNETGLPKNFICYCAPSVTSLQLSGNGEFAGVIVAPNGDIRLDGGGNEVFDIMGSLMVNSAVMHGHFQFHYDEALSRLPNTGRYLISSWDEISIND